MLGEPGAIGVQPAAPHITDTLPVDTWRPDGGGIARWRPVTDRVDVSQLPRGARLLVLTNGLRLKLDGECAAHLAWQLMPEEWRTRLCEVGVAP